MKNIRTPRLIRFLLFNQKKISRIFLNKLFQILYNTILNHIINNLFIFI